MSIYRKFAGEAKSEIYATTVTAPKDPEAVAAAAAREEAERAKRGKGVPIDYPLPRTFQWIAKLPPDVQPMEVLRQFGRIANMLAMNWNDPEATFAYFDQLLVDRRGNRKGFPPEVMAELTALRSRYASLHDASLHALRPGMWDHLRKR
jgi:hypothetical protein